MTPDCCIRLETPSYYQGFNHFSSISRCRRRPGTSIRRKLNSGNVNIDNIRIIIYSTSNRIRKLLPRRRVNMKTEIFAFACHKNANDNKQTIILIRVTPHKMPAPHLWPSMTSEVRGQLPRGGGAPEAVAFHDGDNQLAGDWSSRPCPRSFPLCQIINLNVKRAHQHEVKQLISRDKPARREDLYGKRGLGTAVDFLRGIETGRAGGQTLQMQLSLCKFSLFSERSDYIFNALSRRNCQTTVTMFNWAWQMF